MNQTTRRNATDVLTTADLPYLKTPDFLKKITVPFLLFGLIFLINGCVKTNPHNSPKKYSSDVAVAWMKLNIRLTLITPGFNSIVSDRSFGYAGITLYESIQLNSRFNGAFVQKEKNAGANGLYGKNIFWPASANAAMAGITRDLFGNATVAGTTAIDSLENYFNTQFQSQADAEDISDAASYGSTIAAAVFEWSKTDGGHEAYLHIVDPTYTAPVGDGLWRPTFPAFGPPVHPHWGGNRSFIPGIADKVAPGAPITFSKDANTPFYNMVNELYNISLSLTHTDSITVKFWADVPGNLNVPAHATSILNQLVELNHLDLEKAAFAYAKHGLAMYDASIASFKTKYQYNLLRPITYIREFMGHPNWATVIPTPPHPEYTAAHAVISGASSRVLESIFGLNYHFTDHSYEGSLGLRNYNSFDDYAAEAGISRLLGGIHYRPSIEKGLVQGKLVGDAATRFNLNDLQPD